MNINFLNLPDREPKPRRKRLTCLIDNGVPSSYYQDVVESHGQLIDFIKLGWGTSLVTKDLKKKISIARDHKVDVFLGGTLFEKCYHQNKLKELCQLNKDLGLEFMEISNGTIEMTHTQKASLIRQYSKDFRVISEVGYKDSDRSLEMAPSEWIEAIRADLEAGAHHVITEARESGTSGICRSDGELRFGLITDIFKAGIDPDKLIFEAPNKSLQVYFITRVGPQVNLGNIAMNDVIGVETLRQGLRSDTLLTFEKG